ncbi:molybdopterin converting factor subunit 1 [Saccharibacillus sp. JS10]|uniref:molybdopterin converting factor subunit 1 n=1 Tax=Saccharibacillus sp. JS10 TaxID=2950552 RepID=UPI002109C19B|nr:molybdopterin converting factor subunit 1 [Saccharibacillus sp. JS10]MCQ4085480.1 molybdopterin converting factor subunit 1 [Saccharibacillus sp. JS10]
MITLLYFAGLKDAAGKAQEEIEFAGRTVTELLAWTSQQYPHMSIDAVRVAINEEYALGEDVLQNGDVAALIPPVSGG